MLFSFCAFIVQRRVCARHFNFSYCPSTILRLVTLIKLYTCITRLSNQIRFEIIAYIYIASKKRILKINGLFQFGESTSLRAPSLSSIDARLSSAFLYKPIAHVFSLSCERSTQFWQISHITTCVRTFLSSLSL